MKTKGMEALRKVYIDIGNGRVEAWEAKDPVMQSLGRWSDPAALLRRIHQIQHPEEMVEEGPGRQWQSTWRGRYTPHGGPKSKRAA
jgi:hypothetical protein